VTPDAAFSVLDWTAFVIFVVVIGGIGTLPGPIVGVIVFYILQRLLADYGTVYLIVLGLIWLGWLRLSLPALKLRAKPVTGAWGAFALGVPFSVAICPFCTPALVVLLGVAASIGSPAFGATLLLAFALGRAIPILLGAIAVGWLENLSGLSKFHKVFEVIGGILLILSGLYMLNVYFFVVPGFAA